MNPVRRMSTGRLVSAMKPSGRLHLGNLEGALRTWVKLQDEHELFCFVADWHALTTGPVEGLRAKTLEVALDYLAAGVNPDRGAMFVQSEVKEHAELALLLGMVTPVSWLQRVPTYKDTVQTRRIASPPVGLLAYPLLQAADVLLYRATGVPVGRDQLPHLELVRELARRFHQSYGPLFPEIEAILSPVDVMPGLDGRKMSKSYDNAVDIGDTAEETEAKILRAFTTPTKIHARDPGVPETCTVCQWRKVYDPAGYGPSWEEDRQGKRGCLRNKRELVEIVNGALAPIRARRAFWAARPAEVEAVLAAGAARARRVAQETLWLVRDRMGLR